MRKLYAILLVFSVLWVGADEAEAQLNRKNIKRNNKKIASFRGRKSGFGKNKIYNAVGFSVNALNYYGDLAPRPQRVSTDISFTRPAFAFSFMHRFGPRYTLQGQFLYGMLRGSDKDSADPTGENSSARYLRNVHFRNPIKELSVVAVFDLFENQSTYISRVKWTPYAFLGVAGFHHNPQAKAPATDLQGNPLSEAGKWVKLHPLGTEGQNATLLATDGNFGIKKYSKLQVAIPFGMGARFRINEVMDLWADIAFRYTFTDYLDDVSQNYVDLGVFGNDELAKAMSYRSSELTGIPSVPITYIGRDGISYTIQNGYGSEHPDNVRGSKADRDIYMITSVRLTYILGATFHKAKFR